MAQKSNKAAVPPPTSYRDDPTTSYRDEEENTPSIFDWGDSSSSTATPTTSNNNLTSHSSSSRNESFQIDDNNNNHSTAEFDPDVEIPFTPISLHDDDDNEHPYEDDSGSDVSGSMALRPHNGLLSKVVNRGHTYDRIGTDEDMHSNSNSNNGGERLFVGGGWGRHGSTNDWSGCCRSKSTGKSSRVSTVTCWMIVFLSFTLLAGYLGYEAGLPANLNDEDNTDTTLMMDGDDDDNHENGLIHTTTNGDLWLQWIKDEKEHIQLPHLKLNFTRHKPTITTDASSNQLTLSFPPLSQSELLVQSEHIFQSCSERSIATEAGREACISLCHGHYCCFEKDVEFGSCVTTPNSYCFVYAACENIVLDFQFTNINIDQELQPKKKGGSVDVDGLNREDLELLENTCSKENVASLEGIRDCNAFCQHHLCCFSEDVDENCLVGHEEECEAYESCRIIVDGPDVDEDGVGGGSGGKSGVGGSDEEDDDGKSKGITVTPEQVEQAVYEACYFGEDESKITQGLVAQCHNICVSRYCCFDSQTMVTSCKETVGEFECGLYSLCEQMINDRGGEVNDFIELDMKEFDTTSSSPSSNGSGSGTSFRPGSNGVFIDENEFQATVTEVAAVCNGNQPGAESTWVSQCHSMCADYLCCFATEGTGSNCRDVHGDDVCEAYSGCKVLASSSSAGKLPFNSQQTPQSQPQSQPQPTQTAVEVSLQDQLDEMTETCVPKIRRDAVLRERCRKVCEPRDCCWKSGPGNCYEMNTDWCEEFSLCEILVV